MARHRAHCLSSEHSVPPPVPLSAEHCSTTLPQVICTDGAKSGTFAVLLSAALFGTTGTVLVAAPLAKYLGVSREDFVKPEKKAAEPALP